MRIITLNETDFNNYAIKHKYESFYQTSSYANFEKNNGYNVHYLGFQNENNELVGATMVLYKTLFWNYKYAYAPRGILIDYTDTYLVNDITLSLKKLLYKQNYVFFKIDPPIIASERDRTGKIIYFSNTVNAILDNLKKNDYEHLGFNLYYENILPRWNVFTRLDSNIKNLFNTFDNEIKDKIKAANRMSMEVKEDETNNIDMFYDFIKKGYGKKTKKYFINLFNNYQKDNKIKIFYATIDTNKFVKNANNFYNNEIERNIKIGNIIESCDRNKYDIQSAINDKIESDKLVNILKKEIVLSTELLRKYPNGLTCGTALVIEQNKGVNIYINYQVPEFSKYNVTEQMTFEIMHYYSKKNYHFVNLGPVTGNFDPKSPLYASLKEKVGFNSSIIEYIGEFNLIINPFMYKIYKRKVKREKKKNR